MDISSDTQHLPTATVIRRATVFFAYLIGFMALAYMIGLIPSLAIFVIVFMRMERRENWLLVLGYAAGLVAFVVIMFDQLMALPWPQSLLGELVPVLKIIPSV